MTQPTTSPVTLTIGLDLGDRKTHLCALDERRTVVRRKEFTTTRDSLVREFGGQPRSRLVMEAGPQSLWISVLLRDLGHDVLVVNPRKVMLISRGGRKTDRRDAEMLARLALGMPELLGEAHHRTLAGQADLSVMRARDLLVRTRTHLVAHVRGILKAFGIRLPAWSASCFGQRAGKEIPADLQPALAPVLAVLAELEVRIRGFDHTIEQMISTRHPQAARLRQVVGVGPITAAAFVLTIGDPARFRRSRDVGPWAGLCPKKQESGDADPQLGIAKTGNGFLRRLLVNASHYILGPFGKDCDLRRFGLRLCEHGGGKAKRRAVVAVARKLAVLLHRLLVSGAVYEPLRNQKQQAIA